MRERLAYALLALTLGTTTLAGAGFVGGYFGAGLTPLERYGLGLLLYGLPLVAILGVHELGHWLVMRRAGMRPTLPLFLPVPPPFAFSGTFGAVIGLAERMPDRRTALRVAAAGPLAGLVASVVVLVIGFALSGDAPVVQDDAPGVAIDTPLLYDVLARLLGVTSETSVHPLAIAGWLGLFLTSVQLIPLGQLDGGHLARALLGERRARWLGWAALAALVAMSWRFPGWAILAGLALLTMLQERPAESAGELSRRDLALGAACALAFVATFVAAPFV